MLQLLRAQRQSLLTRDAETLAGINHEIAGQLALADRVRREREEMVRLMTGEEEVLGFPGLIERLPDVLQPMFQALFASAESVVTELRKAARQNRLLLSRAADLNEQILRVLEPISPGSMYSKAGLKHARLGSGAAFSTSA